MKYLLLYIPLILLAASYGYNKKYYRLLYTGRVPEITTANQLTKRYIMLAGFSLVAIVAVLVLS